MPYPYLGPSFPPRSEGHFVLEDAWRGLMFPQLFKHISAPASTPALTCNRFHLPFPFAWKFFGFSLALAVTAVPSPFPYTLTSEYRLTVSCILGPDMLPQL